MASLRLAARSLRHAHRPTRSLSTAAYTLTSHGDISSVLAKETVHTPSSATSNNIIVKWLAAGVDPVDLAAARGEPSAASFVPTALPAVAGTEGVAKVQAVGPDVTGIKTGDHVVPIKAAIGTWCESAILNESQVIPIPNTIRVELAATLSTSPFTALRLLSDYGSLSPGDVIVQNAGSSAVGTAVVQIANAMGLKTVSLVRETLKDYAPTVERLKLMGGDVVIGESYVNTHGFQEVMKDMPAPKLGINGSDAASCALVAELVGKGATVVTYCPGTANNGAIAAKASAASFSLPNWLANSQRADVEAMVNRLCSMIDEGRLTAWLQRVKFEDLPAAIKAGGMTRRKLVAMMDS